MKLVKDLKRYVAKDPISNKDAVAQFLAGTLADWLENTDEERLIDGIRGVSACVQFAGVSEWREFWERIESHEDIARRVASQYSPEEVEALSNPELRSALLARMAN